MTKKQLKELERAANGKLPELLRDMTDVLGKHGIRDMRVFSFKMEALPTVLEGVPRVNNALTATAAVLPAGCVILPDGTIFCG